MSASDFRFPADEEREAEKYAAACKLLDRLIDSDTSRMSRPASAPEARKYPSVGIRNGSEGDAIRCTGARAPRRDF